VPDYEHGLNQFQSIAVCHIYYIDNMEQLKSPTQWKDDLIHAVMLLHGCLT